MEAQVVRRFILDPNNPPTMSKEAWARLDVMTDEEITAAAESNSDNAPLTDEELERAQLVRRVHALPPRAGT
jgi:putative transcriptional regulator